MVFYEGVFVGEPHCDEEETNVFQEAHIHYHNGKTEEEDPCVKTTYCNGQLLALRDTCLKFISTNLKLFKSINCLPYELLETIFHLTHQNNLLDDGNVRFFSNLEDVDFSSVCPTSGKKSNITDKGLCTFAISSNMKLRSIALGRCSRLTDHSISVLAQCCRSLEYLSLAMCTRLTITSIEKITNFCQDIHTLNLAGCVEMTGKVIDHIVKLPKLRKLNLSKLKLTDEATKKISISSLSKRLEELIIRGCTNISAAGLQSLAFSCSKSLRVLDISECDQLDDGNVINIVLACPTLRTLAISDLPRITGHLINWLSAYDNPALKTIAILGNQQLSLPLIRDMVLKKKRNIFGGSIRITVLRNKSFLKPITLVVDQFLTLENFSEKVASIVSAEEESGKCSPSELKFRRVGYRKNGTKRATNLYEDAQYTLLLRELLGHKRFFYLEQNRKEGSLYRDIAGGMFLKVKRWNPETKQPEDIDDIMVMKQMLLGDLKVFLWTEYMPYLPPEKMLIIEEETAMKFNLLLENEIDLCSYDLISGDIIHVEELSDFNFNDKGEIVHSFTQNYFLERDIIIHITETKDSYGRRKQWYDPNEPPNYLKVDIPVRSNATFAQLKQMLSSICQIDSRHMQLYTRVTPTNVLSGDHKRLDDILEGNTWLLVEFYADSSFS